MTETSAARNVKRFFRGRAEAQAIFDAVRETLADLGPMETRVTKSQIAFARRRTFAWVWMPDRWLRGKPAPLVLSIALVQRDSSPRWKEVVQPGRGGWMHHLELWTPDDVDEQVRAWLRRAAEEAT